MNETIKSIVSRRSIRKYKNDMIPKEVIEEIVEAGMYAPTGMNTQSPIILAVTNKDMRDKLSKMNAKVMGNEGVDPFYGAPVVLVVLVDKKGVTSIYDGSLVMGNLMNAAHSLGVGSCWIHRAKEEFGIDGNLILCCMRGDNNKEENLETVKIAKEYLGKGVCALDLAGAEALFKTET